MTETGRIHHIEAQSAIDMLKAINHAVARESRQGFVAAAVSVRCVLVNNVRSDQHNATIEFVKLLPRKTPA
jgi:hypothetical protein